MASATPRLRKRLARRRMLLQDALVLVLALETSTKVGSVALIRDDVTLGERGGGVDARHGDTLVPMIGDVLKEAGCHAAEIGLLAVGLGPGSFTGTRIGAACAKGLHLATGVPLIGVSSFAALAARAGRKKNGRVAVVADAGRGAVFAALFDAAGEGVAPVGETFEASPTAARERLGGAGAAYFVGSAIGRYPDSFERTLDEEFDIPRAVDIAHVGAVRYADGGADDATRLEPLYVRDSDAKLPSKPLNLG